MKAFDTLTTYARQIPWLTENDVWLASFPRAGSTWLRFILCNILSTSELDNAPVHFPTLEQIMPGLGRPEFQRTWKFQTLPRFIKTHQPYRPMLFARPKRTVYLMRDPRPLMVSYFKFLRERVHSPYTDTFAEFVKHRKYGLAACMLHYVSWHDHASHILVYESMKDDTLRSLQAMFVALRIDVAPQVVLTAIERSSLSKMSRSEQEVGLTDRGVFRSDYLVVNGSTRTDWRDMFDEASLRYYASLREQYNFPFYP